MTLKQIEDRLGCPLFETDRKSTLTEMGRFLYGQSVIVLRDYDRAMKRIEPQSKARNGKLRIASVPSVATMLLPGFLQEFAANRPDLDIDLVDTDSTDVRHPVETGEADLGIAGLPADVPGLASETIFRDPFKLVCRSDSPLAQRIDDLDWSDLDGVAMILNEAARNLPSAAFQRPAGQARLSVRHVASLMAMVQAGMGVTLLPALATVKLPAALSARALKDPARMRTVGLCWRLGRTPSPVAQRFIPEFTSSARKKAHGLGLDAH